MKIPYVDLKLQWAEERDELLPIIDRILSDANHVGGSEIKLFEKNIKSIVKTKHVIALNSGTDALTLSLFLMGVKAGDEVITPPNSFIASTSAIVHLGAKPIFVDVLNDQLIDSKKIEDSISKNTKAIMPVHLTGRMCDMDAIMKISKKYNIPVIEDAAQSIGSKYRGKPAGSIGHIGCFSGHPLKNLNAFGDAGYLTTNNKSIADKVRSLANHGMAKRNIVNNFGYVSRMDNIQAGILNFHIKKLDKVIKQRRKNAEYYKELLNSDYVYFPASDKNKYDSYHTFVIQIDKRTELISFLESKGIQTAIHYPIPIHLQPAAKYLGHKRGSFPQTEKQAKRILTLPINQFMDKKKIEYVSEAINYFYEKLLK